MIRNTTESFGSISKALHWIISPLVILMLVAGYFMEDIASLSLKSFVYNTHKVTGIVILFLMCMRLVWALLNPKPRLPDGSTRIEYLAEWFGHFSLYALIILQPLVGWIGSVSAGYVPSVGGFLLNLPLAKDEARAKWCFEVHEVLAIVIIVFVSLHILAALYHHFIRKDNVLKRMMPSK